MTARRRFQVVFFLFENHSQNDWSDRDQTVTVTCSHGVETVEFRYGFKLLRLAFRFQTVTVSHFFRVKPYRVNATGYRVNATSKHKNFVPFSNSAAIHRVNGV